MRISGATIAAEANTFSPMPTSIDAHKAGVFLRPGERPDETPIMCIALLWAVRRRVAADDRRGAGSLTLKRVRLADLIVLYKEFPHTDVVERVEDLLTLVPRTARGEIHPLMALCDFRQIALGPAILPLMRGFVDKTAAIDGIAEP